MNTISVWNKGKRTWPVKDFEGNKVSLSPNESVEMEEVAGLRLINSYPRDLTASKVAGPSSTDLSRREQSLKDREANIDRREKELEEKEKAFAEKMLSSKEPELFVTEKKKTQTTTPTTTKKADK